MRGGGAAQEHGAGASSTESAAEEHGLGISESSVSEDMLEVSSDSETDWRHDSDTTDSESEPPVTTTVSDDEGRCAQGSRERAPPRLSPAA
jgi:hypothetical protein